jgi:hypothetical protein
MSVCNSPCSDAAANQTPPLRMNLCDAAFDGLDVFLKADFLLVPQLKD